MVQISLQNSAGKVVFYGWVPRNPLKSVNFDVYLKCIQISEGALTLWRHSDVIWSSMVLILISVDREGPYLYTGSKYRGISRFA